MKKRIALLVICFFVFISQTVFASGIPAPVVGAESALVMDLNTGQLLYEKDIHKRLAPASTTKVLTAIIVMERCKLDDIVTVGKNPPYEDGSKIYLIEGEKITVRDLLYAMLLESANDTALAFAEHISGSKEAFAVLMNEKAKELGCKDSHFVNPNGLYDDNHYTTAYDLALIGRKALENPTIRKVVSTHSYKIGPTNKQPLIRYINNRNRIVGSHKYRYEGADGLKNGYTEKSKNTLLASATRGERRLLAVELKDNHFVYDDAIKLLDYGFSQFRSENVLSAIKSVTELKITGAKELIPVYPQYDYNISVPVNSKFSITKNVELNTNLKNISRGEVIGQITINLDGKKIDKLPLVSGGEYKSAAYKLQLEKDNIYRKILKPMFKYTFYIAGFVFLLLIFVVTMVRRKRAFKNRRRVKRVRNLRL